MFSLNVFLNLLNSYCEISHFMCVSVSEAEVPKEKVKPSPVKIGIDV